MLSYSTLMGPPEEVEPRRGDACLCTACWALTIVKSIEPVTLRVMTARELVQLRNALARFASMKGSA